MRAVLQLKLPSAWASINYKGEREIKFYYYRCISLVIPSTFTKPDIVLKRRKAYCTAADVEALLKGLKTKIDFDKLETGFDFEKFAFLEIVNVLQLFCANV